MKKILLLAFGMPFVFASPAEEGHAKKISQGSRLTVAPANVYDVYDPEDGEIMKISIFGLPATADNVLMCVKGCKGDTVDTLMALSFAGQKIPGGELLWCHVPYSLVIGEAVLLLRDLAG